MTKNRIAIPSQSELRQLLDYDQTTGSLFWKFRENAMKSWNNRYAGKQALSAISSSGYMHGILNGQHLLAHRVAYKWFHGLEPEEIDHIDGNPLNNAILNLRGVDRAGNARNLKIAKNNKTGVTGVRQLPCGSFRAEIQFDGVNRSIGCFKTLTTAAEARRKAERELDFHHQHGTPSLASCKKEARRE